MGGGLAVVGVGSGDVTPPPHPSLPLPPIPHRPGIPAKAICEG